MGCVAKANHFIHPHMKFALNLRHRSRHFDLRSKSIQLNEILDALFEFGVNVDDKKRR